MSSAGSKWLNPWAGIILVGAGVVLVIMAVFGNHTYASIAESNAKAVTAATNAEAAHRALEATLEDLAAAKDTIAALRARGAEVRTRYVTRVKEIPAPQQDLPSVCDVCVARGHLLESALATSDSVIANQDTTITAQSNAIQDAQQAAIRASAELGRAKSALDKQSKRTDSALPHKLLGLIPLPAASIGYGATLVDGNIRTGPVIALAWRFAF